MDYTILNKLRLEGKLCDVVIEVDGTKFSAHKAVLSASSSYFCALFTSSSDESEPQEFSVSGLSADTMRLLIEHVYAHYPTVTEATVEPLVQAAVGLGFAGVARVCFGFLEARMCPRNCVGIWGMAASYPQPDLELRAYRFILRHFEEVGRTSREFLGLPLPRVCDIVGDDGLNVKEEGVVFDVILRWIGHRLSERKPYISVLLPKVRMSFLDPNYFLHNVMENSVVKESRECRDLLTKTKRFLQNRLVTRLFSSLISAQPCPPRLPHAVLLAVGGWSERSPSSALESYDVRANQWVSVAQDQERPRAYHGAACLGGSVYCVGGRDEEEFFSSVRRFDTATLTWHEAAPMHLRRCYVSVAVLGGRVYAMGGFDGHVGHSSAERYQPEANQWSYIQPMHEQRSDASAAALHGKVYICGGFNGQECVFTAEYYTPETDQWTMIAPMGSRRSGLGVAAYGEEIYAVGGFDGAVRLRTAEAYSPLADRWRPVRGTARPCSNFGLAVLDGRLLTAGGLEAFATTDCVRSYDDATGRWTKVKRMKHSRGALSCCVVSDLPNITQYTVPRNSL
ncbi:kelch-like protein 10 [Anguilla anguilla]|uniref:kelch-like protein 10 n=1 Tax=Anguilla anguilla TaxID=7936 RepID=UPI0015B008C5|nr:kelch-like protein 10 [Anguilla anguilla]